MIAEDKPERCHISKWVVLRGAVNTLIVIRCIRTRLVYTGCRLPAPPPPPTPPPLKRIRTYFRRSHLHRGERYGPGQPFSGSDMTRTSNNLPCPFPSPPPGYAGGKLRDTRGNSGKLAQPGGRMQRELRSCELSGFVGQSSRCESSGLGVRNGGKRGCNREKRRLKFALLNFTGNCLPSLR